MAEKVRYITARSPTFGVQLGGKEYRAEHGVLALPVEAAEELDELVASGERPDISSNVRKIDEVAAKALIAARMAKTQPVAHRGVQTHEISPLKTAQRQTHEMKQRGEFDGNTASPSSVAGPIEQKHLDNDDENKEIEPDVIPTTEAAGEAPAGASLDQSLDADANKSPPPVQVKSNPLAGLVKPK